MATFRKLSSNKIQAIVRIKGYQQHSKSFSTKSAAKQWASKLEDSLRLGELDNTRLTVPDVIDLYLDYIENKACSKRDKYIADKQRVIWKGIKVSEFSLLHLNEYKKLRLSRVSTGTARKDCGFIRRAWNYARYNGYTLPNLFSTFKLPPDSNARQRIPSEHELDMILGSCCSPLLASIIEFASLTAMRRSEILSITPDCVDTQKRLVYLSHTKNGESRCVPLCKRSLSLLRQWHYRYDMMPDSVTKGFSRACKRVDVEGVCFHSLRHYAVSRLTAKGLSAVVVSKISGHKDLRTFLNYNHVDMAEVAKLL